MAKVKLGSRTVRLVHREAEGALLATQLLLAQGVRALPAVAERGASARCSPRKVLRAIRDVIAGRIDARHGEEFGRRLAQALREQRPRTSAKVKRAWPRRVNYKAPKPPKIRVLTENQKALLTKYLKAAA